MSLTRYQSMRGTALIRVSRVGMSIPGITDRTMDSEMRGSPAEWPVPFVSEWPSMVHLASLHAGNERF
jgi:hypothetical protein